MSGSGRLADHGPVIVEGTLEPSASGGIVAGGDLLLGRKSKTKLFLAEERSPDVLDVCSLLRLGGMLEVVVPKAFKPSADDVFMLY